MTAEFWAGAGERIAMQAAGRGHPILFTEAIVSPNATDPKFIRLLFQVPPTTSYNAVTGMANDFALSLGERDVRIARQGQYLAVEVSRQANYRIEFTKIVGRLNLKPFHAYLGVGMDGQQVVANMASPDACHILIGGITGCGKTTLAQSMIASLCAYTPYRNLQVVLLDLKRDDNFARHISDHVHTHACTLADCKRALAMVVKVMKEKERPDCRIVVYCDEINELVQQGGDEVASGVQSIANMGRGLGIGLLLCAQHSKSTQLPSSIKANIPLKISGRVASAAQAASVSGRSKSGAERLAGRGDFIALSGGHEIRFQAPVFAPYIRKRPVVSWERSAEAFERKFGSAIRTTPASPAQPDEDDDKLNDLADRIVAVLDAAPDPDALSADEISRRVSGHRVRGTTYKLRFDNALAIARKRLNRARGN